MSHIVSIKTRVTDPAALAAACRRLGLSGPLAGTAQLYSSAATGLIVHLPGWHYPTVIDIARHAGVSKSTVSFVLQGSPVVRAETKTPVMLVMRIAVCLGRMPKSDRRRLPYLRPIRSPL